MKTRVVAEGPVDALILESVLNQVLSSEGFDVMVAGGMSPAMSLSRSILATTQSRVAVVVDDNFMRAGETDAKVVIEKSLALVADSARFQVFVVRPQFEIVLFRDRGVCESIFGRLTNEQYQRALIEPKGVLSELMRKPIGFQSGYKRFLQEYLAEKDLRPIAKVDPFPSLIDFLKAGA